MGIEKNVCFILTVGILSCLVSLAVLGQDNNTYGRSNDVYTEMKKVADWQWETLESEGWKRRKTDWTNAVLYAGMMEWARVANDDIYYKKLLEVGEDIQWQLGRERHFADDYCVGQTYSQLYELYNKPRYIKDFKQLADSLIILPHEESLLWVNKIYLREWAWCDALFMGPPALGYLTKVTGDQKYLNKASELWWKTSDYLYDTNEHLYFRDSRYFDLKEKNGAKVFWSRGNGWVVGGLVRVLSVMPRKHPDRKKFERQLREMLTRIASLQQEDGTWRASLLDPDSYPSKETSGTGFFCYAMAWAINNGVLPYDKFYPTVNKAWQALTSSVHPNGKLGYVQPLGIAPAEVKYDDSFVYGVGAFLMAGVEMIELEMDTRNNIVPIIVENPTPNHRTQLVTHNWKLIKKQIKGITPEKISVVNAITGEEIAHEVIYNAKRRPVSVSFKVDISAGTNLYYEVIENSKG